MQARTGETAPHAPRPGTLARLRHLYQETVVQRGHEDRLIISSSFLVASLLTRAITHEIRDRRFRFLLRNLSSRSGLHLHHMVFGIIGLLISGYLSAGFAPSHRRERGVLAAGFGTSAALTLDEFALWLNLKDVYWLPQGRESVDALVLGGAVSLVAAEGARFGRALLRDLVWLASSRTAPYPRP
jgi:hypothetical protein